MAWRPDEREAEMLSEENLAELRHNLAHLSLPAVRDYYETKLPGLPTDLQSHTEPAPDADACSGLETVVEMALTSLREERVFPSSFDLPISAAGLAERSGLQSSKRKLRQCLIGDEGGV